MTLEELIIKWEKVSRNKFISAEQQEDDPSNRPTAKRFVEHGAVCYYNCASDLRKALGESKL